MHLDSPSRRTDRLRSLLVGAGVVAWSIAQAAGLYAQEAQGQVAQAQAQAGQTQTASPAQPLVVTETVVVVGEKPAIDTLGAVTAVSREALDIMQANSTSQLFRAVPGMSSSMLGDDPGTVINIRGMQDNGRVLVVVDGARQDFSRPSHAGYGTFYLDPDLLNAVTVTRGPSAGAGGGIGGVVSLETLAPGSLLRGSERVAFRQKVGFETNGRAPVSSSTAAVRVSNRFAVLGNFVARQNTDYSDGSGRRILYTEEEPRSMLFKGVLSPVEHHTVTISYTGYRNDYLASRQAGSSTATLSVDQSDASNDTVSARWGYANPTNRAIDFVVNGYNTQTVVDQLKVRGTAATLGQVRGYDMKTSGFNGTNVSRGSAFGMNHALIVGGEYLHDRGVSSDISNGNGRRDAHGVFAQWEGDYRRLQLIASVRRDGYEVSGLDTTGAAVANSSGKTSPRVSVGVTPIAGLTVYGTYVEGFRAPAIYEIFGIYASGTPYRLGLDLRPEEAQNVEGGVNFKKDDLFSASGDLRVKLNVYNTQVRNYITGRQFNGLWQFNNIAAARLTGTEFDATYSDGWGYAAVSGSLGSAKREGGQFDEAQLSNAPLNRVTASVGLDSFARRLHYGAMVSYIDDKARNTSSAPTAPTAAAYTLTYVFARVGVSSWLDAGFNVDNLFNEAYNDPTAQYATTSPTSFQGRGRTVKFTLTSRFGG